MEANWVSVISSLLSQTDFFKRVHSSGGGEAYSEPLGLVEGGGGVEEETWRAATRVRLVTGRLNQSCVQSQIWCWGLKGNKQWSHFGLDKERHYR